jgi:Glyoxalase/Bleomycin resistance protein/Dioxygenase superfamily
VGFAVEDIRATVGELLAREVKQVTEIEGGPESGQYWRYFQDPEGNAFEVAQQLSSSPTVLRESG